MRPIGLVMVCGIAGLATGGTSATELAVAAHLVAAAPLSQTATARLGARTRVAGFGAPVGNAALEKLSGGSDVSNDMTLNGNVSNNRTDNTETGLNSIASGSFSGATGLPMVIQNSGNGVLIQNATIINVQFKP
jgi:hypothetical protein